MWIKICANTNLEDAQLAAQLGADAVGFVFAPSKRRVTAEQVAAITPHLPTSVERVGVFDSLDAEEIARAVRTAGLNAIQLHSNPDHALARRLHDLFHGEVKIIQTVHWKVDADDANSTTVAKQLREIASENIADRVLIDSKAGAATGGTGITFDWEQARATLAENSRPLKLIVAGGLRPENVAEAISRLKPWGVDVASGVESTPGKKDPSKLAAFINAARSKS
ncbi:N-(5'-phosphoribosyl)anthranilate isomerase [Edaphobacter acidisoli]|uniref:N-(5'-phosphoribosyl)anthranilate isomerase n=1 Tax=Edaphobacter acidisoli TaxID=2040573 RepID=A0A916RTV3_9BACT|nr:phosphoribosylanthranilate isomerase [Edaphobacter acidisoli]GGA69465.1 N-(5'-phosphoribosyl)anthranilate isomerase [Edaphobacter acidisoli]